MEDFIKIQITCPDCHNDILEGRDGSNDPSKGETTWGYECKKCGFYKQITINTSKNDNQNCDDEYNDLPSKEVELPCKELTNMSLEDYIKFKKDIVSRKWHENKGKNRDAHEYYKGQFIILRELLDPYYRRINP